MEKSIRPNRIRQPPVRVICTRIGRDYVRSSAEAGTSWVSGGGGSRRRGVVSPDRASREGPRHRSAARKGHLKIAVSFLVSRGFLLSDPRAISAPGRNE